jgi:amino acid adenylation domain-containing protein
MQPQMSAAYELSPQQRLLFGLHRENSVVGLAILLEGKADSDKLRQAVQSLVDRHEILRTSFQRRTGMRFPFQVVNESGSVAWEEVDLQQLSANEQRARIGELLGEGSKINIETGPALIARLARLGSDRHVLAFTFTILCVDDASLNNLFSEIKALYSGESLAEEVVQYADYSEWQNERLRTDDEEARKAAQFWKRAQIESIPSLSIPFEWKHASDATAWACVPVRCDLQQTTDDEDLLLACWQAFLWRITGQQEFAVGYMSNGRNHDEFAAGIGLFARPLPLIANFENENRFADFLQQTVNQRADALELQDYFAAERIGDHVTVGVVFQKTSGTSAAADITFSEYGRLANPSAFRLQLRCLSKGSSLAPLLDFDRAYFPTEVIAQFAENLAVFIEGAKAAPSAAISELPIITETQRRKVVVDFNQTAAEYSKSKCIHQLFEDQVALHPERPALRCGERELNFSELNQAANRIAQVLRTNGVAPNVSVALCLERSAEMIIALLGVLKAGGYYVPLIPDNPKSRLAHQLAETGAPVLLTEEKHLAQLPDFTGKTICLDRDEDLFSSASDSNPEVNVSPENRVYVIYTSGSTGLPKGVAVRHSNLVHYSSFICQRLELEKKSAGSHFATVSTIAADLGNTCIFPSLISGGCLHVIGYETGMSPAVFSEYASKHPIDVLKITPSHLSTLLNSNNAPQVLPRKYLLLGGEAASWDLINRVRAIGKCAILNHYGPTEATVGCCTFSVDKSDVSAWSPATVPIGRPIANDQVYILDRRMEPLPVGVAGELCIAGAGIAEGYLNQPQQTAERFVRNPFSSEKNARLYRTGDLARFLPDGNIEFLGRIDQQVKIRGFRVEPAEVEAILKRHPAVKQAAVVAYDDKSGEKRLAAYSVGRTKPEELRAFLAQELPEYMLPAAFVSLDSLPLNPNGKLDVGALPSPHQQHAAREFVAPRTPDEEKLAQIWQEVLKLDRVGMTDNFFELGGHSLLATQIISRIRNGFRVQMPLQSFLRNPTIAALAPEIGHCPTIESEQEEMARLLQGLEGISEEEAERLLAAELEKDQS